MMQRYNDACMIDQRHGGTLPTVLNLFQGEVKSKLCVKVKVATYIRKTQSILECLTGLEAILEG
jgi:hypothetical protein